MIVARSLAQKHNIGFESCHWMTGRPDFSIVLSTRPSIFIAGRVNRAYSGRSIHRTPASSPLRGLQYPIENCLLHAHIPSSSILEYTYGELLETSCDDEVAEQMELIHVMRIIRGYRSPNVRDVTLERSWTLSKNINIVFAAWGALLDIPTLSPPPQRFHLISLTFVLEA